MESVGNIILYFIVAIAIIVFFLNSLRVMMCRKFFFRRCPGENRQSFRPE